jgi:large subunit ribosomal protein L10
MKAKAIKQQEVDWLKSAFAENSVIVACNFQGIPVADDVELRRKIRDSGAQYRVVPNRLAKLAAAGTHAEEALSGLKGMTSLVFFAEDDPVSLLKSLVAQSKDFDAFSLRLGVVDGDRLDEQGLLALSKMASKTDTQARVLFLLNSPATSLARQVQAPAQSLVRVLQAAIEEQKFQ